MFDLSAYYDPSYNRHKLFVVKSENEIHEIFYDNFEVEIDFDTQMLIVYTCMTNNPIERELNYVKLDENKLIIKTKDKVDYGDDANIGCNPYQRWMAVKMDKVDYEIIVFDSREYK